MNAQDQQLESHLQELLEETRQIVRIGPSPKASGVDAEKGERVAMGLLPGSFNPLHQAHREMQRHAATTLDCSIHYELSIDNVDKPTLGLPDLLKRIRQFGSEDSLIITRAARFVDKVQQFPRASFVVGLDTLMRLVDSRYSDSLAAHEESLRRVCNGVERFLVFGRWLRGRFQVLSDFSLPECLAAVCQEVPEQQFRNDLSSSKLRGEPDELGAG